eukprot:1747350-Pyramimonas_sp.AAC.1
MRRWWTLRSLRLPRPSAWLASSTAQISEIPLSFAGLGFDGEEYEMDDNDKKELADRTTRLQADPAAAAKAMFGQAAEKAKAYKLEQEQMAQRMAGKRRRNDGNAKGASLEATGSGAASAATPPDSPGASSTAPPPSSQPASNGESLKERASRICHPQPPRAVVTA